jgi:integrase
MGKRANGEGSIYKRKDGRYCATISIEGGRRKAFYGAKREEVADQLAAALKSRTDGLPTVSERQTTASYLRDWLASVESSLRPNTYASYRASLEKHVIPRIGSVRLARLTPGDVQRVYSHCLSGGLSLSTVRRVHAIVHKALEQATKWGLVARNVAHLVQAPRPEHHEIATLSRDHVRAVLDAARGDRFEALYVLAVTTGMRQGELLALRWQDVSLDAGSAQVRATMQRTRQNGLSRSEPKTNGSRRHVSLTRAAVEALQRHRTAQAAERLRMGAAWAHNDLVFPNECGRPVSASNMLRRSFFPLLKRAGVPRVRFHDLRHTAATLMLGESIHPKVVAEMLGHSRISTTLDLYSHVTPTMQRQATEALDAVLSG